MAKPRITLRSVVVAFAVVSTLLMAVPLSASANVLASPTRIKLSHKSGHAGASVIIKGSGFMSGGHVRIRFIDSKKKARIVAKSVTVASNGTFSVHVKVPAAAAKGKGEFVATDHAHAKVAKAPFMVT